MDGLGVFWPQHTLGQVSPQLHMRQLDLFSIKGTLHALHGEFARQSMMGLTPYGRFGARCLWSPLTAARMS